jgi:hypothetical protein
MKNSRTPLQETLNSLIQYRQGQIQIKKQALNENFIYWFPFLMEDIFFLEYEISKFKSMLESLETESEYDVLKFTIKNLKEYCSVPRNVRSDSSSTLSREASTWKYVSNLRIIDMLEDYKLNKHII